MSHNPTVYNIEEKKVTSSFDYKTEFVVQQERRVPIFGQDGNKCNQRR